MRPTAGETASSGTPEASSERAAASSIRAASAAAARRRAMASARVPGEPASSAIPSFGLGEYGAAPRAARASAASSVPPSAPSTRPTPSRVWNAWASGITSPAQPMPVLGIAGIGPSFRRSARAWQRSGLTPASPEVKRARRTATTARDSSRDSHGSEPTARPSSRLRWWAAASSSLSRRSAKCPWPVVTP